MRLYFVAIDAVHDLLRTLCQGVGRCSRQGRTAVFQVSHNKIRQFLEIARVQAHSKVTRGAIAFLLEDIILLLVKYVICQ